MAFNNPSFAGTTAGFRAAKKSVITAVFNLAELQRLLCVLQILTAML
jgi:hypothetical protein